jgi:hypothetical protein
VKDLLSWAQIWSIGDPSRKKSAKDDVPGELLLGFIYYTLLDKN